MKYGFIKVASAAPEIRVADLHFNQLSIQKCIQEAIRCGVGLLVFPELTITGATIGDLRYQRTLQQGALDTLMELLETFRNDDIICTIGLPFAYLDTVYSCAAVIQYGKILALIPKIDDATGRCPKLPETVEVFGDAVSFGTNICITSSSFDTLRIGVMFADYFNEAVYPADVEHTLLHATVVACLSQAPDDLSYETKCKIQLLGESLRKNCSILYASPGLGESTTDAVYDGYACIVENGDVLAEKTLHTGLLSTEIDTGKLLYARQRKRHSVAASVRQVTFSLHARQTTLTRAITQTPFIPEEGATAGACEKILHLQASALSQRIRHVHAEHIVLGVSGGLDSTLAMLAAARAADMLQMPRSQILAVTMPCFGTTQRTKSNAVQLSEALGASVKIVDISKAVQVHFQDIGHDPTIQNVVFENAQARERTQVLMDIANGCQGIVVGTGDLSELALGWATYNGDHMSMYGVNGGIPKTLLRQVVTYAAKTAEDTVLQAVLESILDTPVSPELLPAQDGEITQVTEDVVGPYVLHDFFLYHGIVWGAPPEKVLHLAQYAFSGVYDKAVIKHWMDTFYRRFFSQQFKRSCLPDGLKVLPFSLSPRAGFSMPSDAASTPWREEILRLQQENT